MTGPRDDTLVTITRARFDGVIFDMDGVITDTAGVHADAWAHLFDEYLAELVDPEVDTSPLREDEYRRHLDGRARVDGVEAFLDSRGVALPRGSPADSPNALTEWGLANRKNRYFLDALERTPPTAFPSSVALVEALQGAGIQVAVVTASANRAEVLAAAGVTRLFPVHVDGGDAATLGLPGKPDPALFLEAAQRLGVARERTVVVEDAAAGVAAARRGGFGLVVGVDRDSNTQALRDAGAHAVVADLAQVAVTGLDGETQHHANRTDWRVSWAGYAEADEGRRETLGTLGNGLFATRAAAPESSADGAHYPGTYAAGLYNRLVSQIGERSVEHESLVNLPNWLPLSFRPGGGEWLDLAAMTVDRYEEALDLRRGVLRREFRVTDAAGRTTALAERRIVHMGRPHLAALEWTITPDNWSGTIEIRSGLDGTVENHNVAAERDLDGRHLSDVTTGQHNIDALWLKARTTQSERHIAVACRTTVETPGHHTAQSRATVRDGDRIEHLINQDLPAGAVMRVEKIAALHTSLDHALADVRTAAVEELDDATSLAELVEGHELAWSQLWRDAHIDVHTNDPQVASTLNLHTFHLLQTLSPHIVDRDVGVPARGLHGEGYRGHVFWDELFIFPYLNLRFPGLTRELLLYRYRRLPAARRMAAAMGCRGARFPWQSGSDGREETPSEFFNPRSGRWMADNSRRQHHVSLAVAFEVWQHHQVTGDRDFLASYGAELLVEIARFWVDLAQADAKTGRYSIRGVMGPDEFHDGYPDRPGSGIDDNAYTNTMVSWLLRRAVDTYHLLADRGNAPWDRLELEPEEPAQWDHVSRHLHVPFRSDGTISQFAGYDDLDEFDWDRYRHDYDNVGRLDLILEAEGDSPNRYKLSKQADVLMLLYLFSAQELTDLYRHLGYGFDPSVIPAMIEFYTAHMSHGSTLCRVAMARVLARADRAGSWRVFRDALVSDVADTQGGTTPEGIHLGAMAGTIDLVQRCYPGLEIRDNTIAFDPHLPDELTRLTFPFTYRNQRIQVTITQEEIELWAQPGPALPLAVAVRDKHYELQPGDTIRVALKS